MNTKRKHRKKKRIIIVQWNDVVITYWVHANFVEKEKCNYYTKKKKKELTGNGEYFICTPIKFYNFILF